MKEMSVNDLSCLKKGPLVVDRVGDYTAQLYGDYFIHDYI